VGVSLPVTGHASGFEGDHWAEDRCCVSAIALFGICILSGAEEEAEGSGAALGREAGGAREVSCNPLDSLVDPPKLARGHDASCHMGGCFWC
jgi:hypothetical protein